jgi:excisionase family DNA binding protein
MFEDSKIYTAKELAEKIKMSVSWIYEQIIQNKIPHVKMGNRARFLGWRLNEWIKEGMK